MECISAPTEPHYESRIKIKEKPTAVLKSTGTSREFRAFPIPLPSFIYGRMQKTSVLPLAKSKRGPEYFLFGRFCNFRRNLKWRLGVRFSVRYTVGLKIFLLFHVKIFSWSRIPTKIVLHRFYSSVFSNVERDYARQVNVDYCVCGYHAGIGGELFACEREPRNAVSTSCGSKDIRSI